MSLSRTESGSSSAEAIRAAWNFQDPRASEARFRELAQAALQRGELAAALELQTQVARAQGLERRFDDARAMLAAVQAQLDGQPAVVRMRWLLEQGRVLNSSGQPRAARPSFEQAWQLGQAEQLDGLAVDAAHMLAITFRSEPESAIAWNEQALALATRIAQWCVGRALRALGKTQPALEIQQALLAETPPDQTDGFVLEELGELYLALGDAARAQEHFARAHAELSRDEGFRQNETARLERIARLGGIQAPPC